MREDHGDDPVPAIEETAEMGAVPSSVVPSFTLPPLDVPPVAAAPFAAAPFGAPAVEFDGRPVDYQGRRRDPSSMLAGWPDLDGSSTRNPRLVFGAVLAVALSVVVAVSAISAGAPPNTAPLPVVPTNDPPRLSPFVPGTSASASSSTAPATAGGTSPRASRSASRSPSAGPSVAPPPLSPPPTPPPMSFEAEAGNNTRGPGVNTRDVGGASGGKVVGNIGRAPSTQNPEGTLRFNDVTVLNGGRYTATIHYAAGESRNARIRVNGGSWTQLAFSVTGGWNTIGSRTHNVDLVVGTNTIEIGNNTNWAPDFDRIVISPAT